MVTIYFYVIWVASVMGSIPAPSDTVKSEGAADEAVLNNV
jgi:hypothetical protein